MQYHAISGPRRWLPGRPLGPGHDSRGSPLRTPPYGTPLRLKTILGLAIPLAFAALFVRFGFWQLSRHREIGAQNAALAARLAESPVPFDSLRGDTATTTWARVTLSGRFRYDLELVLGPRVSEGSPGVFLLTPLERPGNDTLVLVTRGWVYSADGSAVERERWREADSVSLAGYVLAVPAEGPLPPSDTLRPVRVLSQSAVRARLKQPFASAQVVMTSDSTARADSVPRRLPLPMVDAGPHFSYMLQWFAFATIALIGGVILTRRGIVAERSEG